MRRHWAGIGRPLIGAVCLAAVLAGVSYQLEGAPVPKRDSSGGETDHVQSALRAAYQSNIASAISAERPSTPSNAAIWARAGQVPSGGYPIFDPVVVNYKDDEPSRLRAAGLLHGALPLSDGGIVAAGGCTYDIQCEDANPCTRDVCVIDISQGLGSGKCTHALELPGEQGDCDDGVFCNGKEFCNGAGQCQSGLVATCCLGGPGNDPPLEYCSENAGLCGDDAPLPGKLCASDADCGGKECQHCRPKCTNNTDSDDTSVCNGDETCDANGHVVPSIPTCGVGALCSEKKCSSSGQPKACNIDEDCGAGFTCTGVGPVCFFGRCCPLNAEPDQCTFAKLAGCTGGKLWFEGDAGSESTVIGECGGDNPNRPGVQLGCPKYTSGITQIGTSLATHPVAAGPASRSSASIDPPNGPGTPFLRIGDDYSFDNNAPIALDAIRFLGYMAVSDAIFIEFWDENGNLIEDFLYRPTTVLGVNQVVLEEPLVIPHHGRVSAINKPEFGPQSKFVWMSAGAVEDGGNNPNILFVNNDPNAANYMTPSPGILSFELVGRKVAEPLGGCCHHGSGECTNELDWICETRGECVGVACVGGVNDGLACSSNDECTGTFQGVGNYCNTCQYGENVGAACGRCSVGAAPCNADTDCSSGTCDANHTVCNNKCVGGDTPNAPCLTVADCPGSGVSCVPASSTCSNDTSNTCTSSTECVLRVGVCSNRDQGCVLNSDCPPGGVCGGAGTCEAGVCAALDSCGVGACCSPTTGACTQTNAGGCTGSGGTFMGLGVGCKPNCCEQPYDHVNADVPGLDTLYDNDCTDGTCYTGADDCPNAIVSGHVVPLLDPSDPPYIITMTGNDAYATSTEANPDACVGVPSGLGGDRGWFEGFSTTDTCTRLRIDLCCSTPTQFANLPFLWTSCGCGNVISATPDPNLEQLLDVDRGLPYCEEDNLWIHFGLVGPGTFFYSPLSDLEVTTGPYQMHVVAEACPEAACCKPDGSCIDGVNQLECNNLDGMFLAPPQQFPATPLCSGDPGICATGSCCTGPGKCLDEVFGDTIVKTDCETNLGGRYIGGIRCQGGLCDNDIRFSCNSAVDCDPNFNDGAPGGSCGGGLGGQRAMNQPNPCPICEHQVPGQCNLFDGSGAGVFADLNHGSGLVGGDDFVAGPGLTQIDQVCVWGYYFKTTVAGDGDCADAVLADHFRVRILRPTADGLPDRNNVVGSSTTTSVRAEVKGISSDVETRSGPTSLRLTRQSPALSPRHLLARGRQQRSRRLELHVAVVCGVGHLGGWEQVLGRGVRRQRICVG